MLESSESRCKIRSSGVTAEYTSMYVPDTRNTPLQCVDREKKQLKLKLNVFSALRWWKTNLLVSFNYAVRLSRA